MIITQIKQKMLAVKASDIILVTNDLTQKGVIKFNFARERFLTNNK
jgi:hypothetical protein